MMNPLKPKRRQFKMLFTDWPEYLLMNGNYLKVWLLHWSYEDKNRQSFLSIERVCAETALNEKTVKAARRWLVENEWLEKVGDRGNLGRFKVPVFRVRHGVIPQAEKGPTVPQAKKRPRTEAKKRPTDRGQKTAPDVYKNLELDSKDLHWSPLGPKTKQPEDKTFENIEAGNTGKIVSAPEAEKRPTVNPEAEKRPTVKAEPQSRWWDHLNEKQRIALYKQFGERWTSSKAAEQSIAISKGEDETKGN